MNDLEKTNTCARTPSASQLRKPSPEERSAVLSSQAKLADPHYRADRQPTSFEAFGEEDPHGDVPVAEAPCDKPA